MRVTTGAKRKVDEVERGDGPLDGEARTTKQQRVTADGASATPAAAAVADVASVGSGGGGATAHNGASGSQQSGDGATPAPDSAAAADGAVASGTADDAQETAGGAGAGAADSAGDATGASTAAEIAAKKEADHEAQRLERALQAAKALRDSIQNGMPCPRPRCHGRITSHVCLRCVLLPLGQAPIRCCNRKSACTRRRSAPHLPWPSPTASGVWLLLRHSLRMSAVRQSRCSR